MLVYIPYMDPMGGVDVHGPNSNLHIFEQLELYMTSARPQVDRLVTRVAKFRTGSGWVSGILSWKTTEGCNML